MNEFIETKAILYDNIGEKSVCPLLLNLSKVTAVCRENNECHVYTDDARFHLPEKEYDALCTALKVYRGDNLADKLCELQNDHTWVMQAMGNLLFILKQSDDRAPKVLLNCCDKDMEALLNECFKAARAQSKRIKELEAEISLMREPKRYSND